MVNGRILFDLTLLACSGWGFFAARSLPPAFSPGQIGPGFFPASVAGLGVLVMFVILVGDLRRTRSVNGSVVPEIGKTAGLGALVVVVLLVAYIQLIEPIGFRFATTLFLFLGILTCHFTLETDQARPLLSLRFVGLAALTATVVTLATYTVFTQGFGLNLP